MKATITKARNTEKVSIFGKMDLATMETGTRTELRAKEFTNGKTERIASTGTGTARERQRGKTKI